MDKHVLALICALAVLALTAQDGLAQDGKDSIALFNEASDLAEKGQFEDAIAIWVMVADVIPDKYRPVVQVNLGLAYKNLGKLPQAWHHLGLYLQSQPDGDKEAQTWRAEVETELLKTHTRVTVNCEPSDAQLFIQGEGTAKPYPCPMTWWFKPGKRIIQVERDGYQKKMEVLNVEQGKDLAVTAKLATTEEYGYLEIRGNRRAVPVFLNGMLEGKVPFKRRLKPGAYELMLGPPGEMPWKKTVTIEPGQTVVEEPAIAQKTKKPVDTVEGKNDGNGTTVIAKPDPVKKSGTKKGLGWGLAGGGAAVGIGGLVCHLLAFSRNNGLQDDFPDGTADNKVAPEVVDAYNKAYDDEVKPLSTAAYVLYGVGGAALAAGVVVLILDAKDGNKDTATNLVPMLGSDHAGIGVSFTW